MLPHVEPTDLAASVDELLNNLGGAPLSMKAAIASLRATTGTERSDADLEGLITKKGTVSAVTILFDRESS
ncbi:hypothetical protein BPNPMPFG_002447 [Mesorhizobium sp. AR07]|uniref:hypothetical protein n=1 Tax=Mesorhizobium sp. AR07 TaxID=2865838 RepID=UPI002160B66C|nr:hypothetical protein [Mesorhizobium sp. AR07]UVK46740.1 hypothetical protein BPNPMPFG_002447 [Mesorhizobium sp. AR07]